MAEGELLEASARKSTAKAQKRRSVRRALKLELPSVSVTAKKQKDGYAPITLTLTGGVPMDEAFVKTGSGMNIGFGFPVDEGSRS